MRRILVRKAPPTRKRFTLKVKKKIFIKIAVGAMLLVTLAPTNTQASPPYGFGQGHGRTAPVNVNDYSSPVWERFRFNYTFESGPNHRYELGRPTTFSGTVPQNVFTVNTRRDSNVAFSPPSYDVFSGEIPTMPSNPLFPQPVNPHFTNPWETHNPNVISRFDTIQQGVNFQPQGNQMNMFNVDSSGPNLHGSGFLPSTSIGVE